MKKEPSGLPGLLFLVGLVLLLVLSFYLLAFGADLPSRPSDYQLVDAVKGACGGQDVSMLQWGLGDDFLWGELYLGQRLIAIVVFAPGERGALTDGYVLLPSGTVRHLTSAQAMREAGYNTPCDVVKLWEQTS